METSGDDDTRDHPTYDQPLNGPRKGGVKPLILVVSVLAAVVAVFALITAVRYST